MSGKVWVVEQGQYSDYEVVGIFSTQELADAAAAMMNESSRSHYDKATVAERDLDPYVSEMRAGQIYWMVWMGRDGAADVSRSDPFNTIGDDDCVIRGRFRTFVWAPTSSTR